MTGERKSQDRWPARALLIGVEERRAMLGSGERRTCAMARARAIREAPAHKATDFPNFSRQRHYSLHHVPPSARSPLLEGPSRPLPTSPHSLINSFLPIQDLGKSSNDLLGKDFPLSGVALEVKTATPSNVSFKVGGNRDTKSALIGGDIKAKFFAKPHGLVFTQAWTTNNILKTQVEIDNQIAKGVKLDLQTALTPDTGAKTALFTTTYKQPGLHTRAFLDIFKVRRYRA